MGVRERLKKLEVAKAEKDYHFELFVVEPGGEGRDAEGFTPEDREKYQAAELDDAAHVHIITVVERKPPRREARGD